MTVSIREQIIAELYHLTAEQQAELLDIARRRRHTLSTDKIAARQAKLPPGVSGEFLADHVKDFALPPGEVEEDWERIAWDGWR